MLSLVGIPRKSEVLAHYPSPFNPATFQWKVESETFPLFCGLLCLPEYRHRVILGLVVSVGGLTERLVKHSSASLFSELRKMDRKTLDEFVEGLLHVFKDHEVNPQKEFIYIIWPMNQQLSP